MWLFRKSLDLRRATPRPATADDLPAVARLLRDGARRYYALSGGDMPGLLAGGYGALIEVGPELWGAALVSWPAEGTCWLRALALAEGVDPRSGVAALLDAFHAQLAAHAVRAIYYAGDDAVDGWLIPALEAQGYQSNTEVVVYEKRDWEIPDAGNPDVRVRPAGHVDLAEVLRIDRACFEPQWTKDATILGPALLDGPFFMLAELDGAVVGYAYATSHFGGRLVHLVRIAVDPAWRGASVGVRLLAEVTAFGANQRADLITLNTQAYNSHAQRLYRWFGFVRTGERQLVLRWSSP